MFLECYQNAIAMILDYFSTAIKMLLEWLLECYCSLMVNRMQIERQQRHQLFHKQALLLDNSSLTYCFLICVGFSALNDIIETFNAHEINVCINCTLYTETLLICFGKISKFYKNDAYGNGMLFLIPLCALRPYSSTVLPPQFTIHVHLYSVFRQKILITQIFIHCNTVTQ